jgi:predicted PurR-regulated permease PerM
MAMFFARHWRAITLTTGIIVGLWLLYWLRAVALPFGLGLVIAYLLMPIVYWLEERLPPKRKQYSYKRVLSIFITFVILLAILAGFGYFMVTTAISASKTLVENAPYFFGKGLFQIQQWLNDMKAQLPIQVRQEIDQALIDAGVAIGAYVKGILSGVIIAVPGTITTIMGFAVLPFFLFYIMKDLEMLKKGLVSVVSPAFAFHGRNIMNILEGVLGRYIRAQLMLGLIVGYFAFIGLLLLNVPFALPLGLLAGVTELIPTLGPWIGGSIAVLVAIAMAPDKVIWVAVLFAGIQLLENTILVPRVQSAYLRIHPAIMIALIVFGTAIGGFWGLLLVGPLTATLVRIVKYIRKYYGVKYPPEIPFSELED